MISFIVALAAVIISAFQESVLLGCGSVSLEIDAVDSRETICYTDDHLEFTLNAENVEGVKAEIQGHKRNNDPFIISFADLNKPFRIAHSSLTYGNVKKVSFTPISEKKGSECPSKVLTKQGSNINRC